MSITSGFYQSEWTNLAERFVFLTGSSAQTYVLGDATKTPGLPVTLKLTGTGVVTVDGFGSQTIDGALTFSLATQYSSVSLVSDGDNWAIVDSYIPA